MSHLTRTTLLASLGLAGALTATGCGTQTDDDYQGEALLTLAGTVVNETPSDDAAQVTMIWAYDNGDGDQLLGEAVEVSGEFPASFTLELHLPPAVPDIAAIGYITALTPGSSAPPDEGDLIGVSEDNVVVYLAIDVASLAPDDRAEAAEFFGDELTAGYHLMEVIPGELDQQDTMSEVPSDTPITVRMAPAAELDFPQLY